MTNDRRMALCEVLSDHDKIDLSIMDGVGMETEARKVSSANKVRHGHGARHVEVLKSWLASGKPLILCGPPGGDSTE